MSTTLGESLSRAFQHIEAEEHSEALEIIEPLLETERDNADVWWLYAHATHDIDEARQALNRVTRLQPGYPGAAELLDQISTRLSGAPSGGIRRLGERAAGSELAEEDDFDLDFADDFEDIDTELTDEEPTPARKPRSRRRFLLPVALLAILAVVVILAVLLLGGGNGEKDVTATAKSQVVDRPTESNLIPTVETTAELTEEPTIEPSATETTMPEDTPTPSPSPEPEATAFDIEAVFSAFSLPEDMTTVVTSNLGQTYVVSVCAESSQNQREILNDAMAALSEAANSITDRVDAVAVELLDCTQDRPINMIGVPFTIATGFFEGTVAQDDFVRQWRVITALN